MAVGSYAPAALARHPLDIQLAALIERAEKAAKARLDDRHAIAPSRAAISQQLRT